jgi:hypothetical protein
MSDLEILKQKKAELAEYLEHWRSRYQRYYNLTEKTEQADFYEGVLEMARHMAVTGGIGHMEIKVTTEGVSVLQISIGTTPGAS